MEETKIDVSEKDNSPCQVDDASKCDLGEVEPDGSVISKRKLKRMKRHQEWLDTKAERRKGEKMKKKRKFIAARERGDDLGPSRKSLKKNSMSSSLCKTRVVLDCSFDSYMTEKDVRHLVQQIQHSYAANRRADNPLQFYACGVGGKAQERLESIGDYKGWDVYFKSEEYLDLFPKGDIVYLSSESPNILQDLEDSKVYVIGGLVDHNHHKGLCHELAEQKGLAHAQLPISEYIDMKTRKVLTINHVFEILLRYTETRDWEESFFSVLPLRKGAAMKEHGTDVKLEGDESNSAGKDDPTELVTDKKLQSVDNAQSVVVGLIDDEISVPNNVVKSENELENAKSTADDLQSVVGKTDPHVLIQCDNRSDSVKTDDDTSHAINDVVDRVTVVNQSLTDNS